MDITQLTIDQLKVMAYDMLAELERLQANLRLVNEQIRVKAEQAQKASENKDEERTES